MSRVTIQDLEFCQTEPSNDEVIRGQGWVLNDLTFQPFFTFNFSHNRIGSFAQGYISAFGIAIGPRIVITSE